MLSASRMTSAIVPSVHLANSPTARYVLSENLTLNFVIPARPPHPGFTGGHSTCLQPYPQCTSCCHPYDLRRLLSTQLASRRHARSGEAPRPVSLAPTGAT